MGAVRSRLLGLRGLATGQRLISDLPKIGKTGEELV